MFGCCLFDRLPISTSIHKHIYLSKRYFKDKCFYNSNSDLALPVRNAGCHLFSIKKKVEQHLTVSRHV